VNTLIAYLQLGGEVWLLGGGGAMATLNRYNELQRSVRVIVFSSQGASELIRGRSWSTSRIGFGDA